MSVKKGTLKTASLYIVLDTSVADFRKLFFVLQKSVDAGAQIVQLRSKQGSAREILAFCKRAVAYVKGKALFIVNDRVDIAQASKADGVHLGQNDIPYLVARRILGADKIIGVSCQKLAQARQAQKEGADYIGFGSVFKTKTKPERSPMDFRLLSSVSSRIKIPVFFIGGITLENVGQVIDNGSRRVAVTRAICESRDPGGQTEKFVNILRG